MSDAKAHSNHPDEHDALPVGLERDDLLRYQRRRWQLGIKVRVEDLLRDAPGLAANHELTLDLIYNEILLREEVGESADCQEYIRRFPQFASDLHDLFVIHGYLDSDVSGVDTVGSTKSGNFDTIPQPVDWPSLPGLEVLRTLGHGGMGSVYLARQQDLNRLVACKVLGAVTSRELVERSRREALAIARLQHPHIVQVFDVRETATRPVLLMEYVAGGNLATQLRGTLWTPAKAARLLLALADGVQCIHDARLIHRDLKPSNILLNEQGVPKIADFGLARFVDDPTRTRPGTLIGTPAYMAPEQLDGDDSRLGPPTDVYALGVILYEAVTGRPPFLAEKSLETMEQVRHRDPVAPRRLVPSLPRDLETVILKCLRKEPRDRYATAAAFAADLRAFLENRPITARPVSSLTRAWKWCRRHPAAASLLAVPTLSLFTISGLCVAVAHSAHRAHTLSEMHARDAIKNEQLEKRTSEFLEQIIDMFSDRAGDAPARTSEQNAIMRRDRIQRDLDRLRKLAGALPADFRVLKAQAQLSLYLAQSSQEVGDVEASRHLLQSVGDLNRRLDQQFPGHPLVLHFLQWSWEEVGRRCHAVSDFAEAQEAYESAEAVGRKLLELPKLPPDVYRQQSLILNSLAILAKDRFIATQNPELLQAAVRRFESLIAFREEMPYDDERLRLNDLADAHGNLGAFLNSAPGRDGKDHLEKALALHEQLLEGNPDSASLQMDVLRDSQNLLLNLITTKRESDRWDEMHQKCLRRYAELDLHLSDADFDYRSMKANFHTLWAFGELDRNRAAEALASLDTALPHLGFVIARVSESSHSITLAKLAAKFRRDALRRLEQPDAPPSPWQVVEETLPEEARVMAEAEYGLVLAYFGYEDAATSWLGGFRDRWGDHPRAAVLAARVAQVLKSNAREAPPSPASTSRARPFRSFAPRSLSAAASFRPGPCAS